ncbi:MAG: tetratricopeptide repeat protein [candidate division Zixibacteria bacterium]|nr:tetratricopeptide repeat protein [candidate division Zixibacteria bacterium]
MKEKIQDLSLTKRLEQVEPLLEKDNYAEAWEMLKQIEILGDLKINSRERGIFYYLSSVALHGLGRFKESLEFGENAYELFKNTLENKRIAEVQSILGKSYLSLGRLKEAENQFRDSVATCRRISDEKGIVRNYNKLAQIYSIRADYPRAIEYLKECIPYLEKIKDWINLSIIQRNLGRIYILRGELSLAEKHLLSDIRLLKEAGKEHILNLSRCLLSLGYIKLLKREFKPSSSYLRRAYELLKDNKSPRDLAIYYEYQGETYFHERKFDEADACYKKALQIGEEIAPQGTLISQTCRLLADLALQRKEIDKAFEFINRSLEVSRVIGEKLEEGIGYRILGEIYHQKNEESKSREAFDKSIKSLEETGARYEQIKTYLSLSLARGYDYPEKLSSLERSKKLSSGLGLKYLEALSELTHSQLEFERENFENSLYALNRAEHLFSEPPEEDKLLLCRELREKIENNLSRKSISAENEFKLFRNIFPIPNTGNLKKEVWKRV